MNITDPDPVNHPPHYTSHPSGVECITITRHMGFNLGNALKYIWRADLKDSAVEDLEKAAWYIQDEIKRREQVHVAGVPAETPEHLKLRKILSTPPPDRYATSLQQSDTEAEQLAQYYQDHKDDPDEWGEAEQAPPGWKPRLKRPPSNR